MKLPIRAAVLASPNYPFVPINAPVKLDQNEAAEDFPASLKALVLERLGREKWHRYTDLNAETLCAAIARYEGWSPSGVVVTTGSNVLIALLIQLAALDKSVVTVTPNFSLYGLDAKLLGAALTEVPLRSDLTVDMDGVIAATKAKGNAAAHAGGIRHAPVGVRHAHHRLGRPGAHPDLRRGRSHRPRGLGPDGPDHRGGARVETPDLFRRHRLRQHQGGRVCLRSSIFMGK